jgi:hypothetical protein
MLSSGRNDGPVAGSGRTSYAGRIADRLETWSGVSKVRADCGVGVALQASGNQIVHLHTDSEAELRLTRPVVERLGDTLTASGQVAIRPGGEWVVVRLDTDSDVALVISLASVAIKANTTGCTAPRAHSPCGAAVRPPSRTDGLRSPHGGRLRRLSAVLTGNHSRHH